MTILDRALQRHTLGKLAEVYPALCSPKELGAAGIDPRWGANVLYLEEHGLVETLKTVHLDDGTPRVVRARITAAGLDFLADDGGLTAVLGVVMVRFDADTLKAFIGDHIEACSLPDTEKSKIKGWLLSAGAEALKETTKRLVGAAIDHAPEALQLLQTLRG